MECNICGKPCNAPWVRVVAGEIRERCVCTCHDEHLVRPSNAASFVLAARRAKLTGFGIDYGAGRCGR